MTEQLRAKALVTGASSGIGAVYADRLAHRGHNLVLVARDAERMNALADTLRADTGRSIEMIRADLTDSADLALVVEKIETDASIGMLINNAGMSLNGSLMTEDPANVARLIALNITAPTMLAGAAARAFPARGGGAILMIASVLALAPEQYDGVYSGSKAYLLNLSLSLANALADKDVLVQAVLPGATRTEIWARSGKDIDALPTGMVMGVDDLVDAALLGLDRGERVTIPPLPDVAQWEAMQAARLAMAPNLSRRAVADRYRPTG